jgi:hypothetical protein
VLTVGSLFAGIGGFDLGLERAGMRVLWQCEIDPYAQRVLAKHWPDVLLLPDIRGVCSPAKTSPLPAEARGSTESARVFGASTPDSFASYDPATSSWRTSQPSLLGGWESFSATWPRAGMTRSGTAFRLQPLAPLTRGTESGLWPTPTKSDGAGGPGNSGRAGGVNLRTAVRMWPTPQASDGSRGWSAKLGGKRPSGHQRSVNLNDAVAHAAPNPGPLNPTWVEWLMGFPLGWTALPGSETPSSHRSRSGSAGASSKEKGST